MHQYDRSDVTARGLANWYAQILGQFFTESNKPFEVELVVAEVGDNAESDQIYRLTYDGSVSDEQGFVAMGGQADQVAAVLKDHYADDLPLVRAGSRDRRTLAYQGNGEGTELSASQLEVGILARDRVHRTFRRLTGARLEVLLAEAAGAQRGIGPAARRRTPGTSRSPARPPALTRA